jgi:hypothetical protein
MLEHLVAAIHIPRTAPHNEQPQLHWHRLLQQAAEGLLPGLEQLALQQHCQPLYFTAAVVSW